MTATMKTDALAGIKNGARVGAPAGMKDGAPAGMPGDARDDMPGARAKILVAVVSLCVAALYFKNALLVCACAALIYVLAMPLVREQIASIDRKRIRNEALLWLEELTISLKAGKSLSEATKALAYKVTHSRREIAAGRLTLLLSGASHDKARQSWRYCLGLLRLGYPISNVYQELAHSLDLAEFKSLAGVIGSAVQTGANLPYIFTRAAECLREQLNSAALLEASLASRRLEGCLLAAAPAAYTAFLRFTTPDYMAPLYTGKGWVLAALVFALQLGGSLAFFRALSRERAGGARRDLAGFQEDIALHIEAGLSLPEAWRRAALGRVSESGVSESGGANAQAAGFQDRLALVSGLLAVGLPFSAALEKISADKGGEEGLCRLAELLRQNYSLGGGAMVSLLRLEAGEIRQRDVFERQASDAKRQTIVLFPMILLLLSALVLTAAPAMLSV